MWIRVRLDIAWRDLVFAAAYCMQPGKRSKAIVEAERTWSRHDDNLITLSVRSAFDLTLRALQLPSGSEILLTALTVPDMVVIVRSHGLVPVPLDIDDRGNICLTSLRKSISSRTRMLVVAHLFGSRVPLDEVLEIVRPHKLYVVEDCAQSFDRVGDHGHSASDIVMHSFGPIKTATALGGAVIRVSSPRLRQRMANTLGCDPIQTRANFARRLARFAVLKALSGNCVSVLFCRCVHGLGFDVDSLINSLGRGFDSSSIMEQIRRQPSTPLLRLLRRRWRTYDFTRIDRRRHLGHYLDHRTRQQHSPAHSYWMYPLFVRNANAACDRLRAAGFDATCQSRMIVVPSIDDSRVPTSARRSWNHVLFLPWYPELTQRAVDEMAKVVRYHRPSGDA